MKHSFYPVRRHGFVVNIKCHHCDQTWTLKSKWIVLFFALQTILPVLFLFLYALLPMKFSDEKLAIIFALLMFTLCRYLPAHLLCKYMQYTGKTETFFYFP